MQGRMGVARQGSCWWENARQQEAGQCKAAAGDAMQDSRRGEAMQGSSGRAMQGSRARGNAAEHNGNSSHGSPQF
jgi:hypothetical protein